MLIMRLKGALFIVGNWTAHSWNLWWYIESLKICSLSLLCGSTHSLMHSAPMFVASWTTPWLPAPPPPAWLLPHFHGHVLMAFSILQGEYHASFSKECAEISKPCPQQVDLAELQSDYRTKPFVHIHRTDITCICGPTHSSHTAFLRSLDFAPHASMDTFIRYPR